jgi:hypothetical protein
MWQVWGGCADRGRVGILRERDHFQDLGVNGRAWTEVTRLRIGTGGRMLCRWSRIVGLHQVRGISLLLEKLVASQALLLPCELISYAYLPCVHL